MSTDNVVRARARQLQVRPQSTERAAPIVRQGDQGGLKANEVNIVVSKPAILAAMGFDMSNPFTHATLLIANRYNFDPILKHIVIIPGKGNRPPTVYVTRDGLLFNAHNHGQLDGIVLEKEEVIPPRLQVGTAGQRGYGKEKPDIPPSADYVPAQPGMWKAVVTVYRKDMKHGFTYPGTYPFTGSNTENGPAMAIKVAECFALRRAFPVGGLPVYEEAVASGQEEYRADLLEDSAGGSTLIDAANNGGGAHEPVAYHGVYVKNALPAHWQSWFDDVLKIDSNLEDMTAVIERLGLPENETLRSIYPESTLDELLSLVAEATHAQES